MEELSQYTDEQIKSILKQYKKSLEYQRHVYHTRRKLSPDFMEKNRERAKAHYLKNKEKKDNYYSVNKEIIKTKNQFRYYQRKNNIAGFKNKFPEKYEHLVSIGFITEES